MCVVVVLLGAAPGRHLPEEGLLFIRWVAGWLVAGGVQTYADCTQRLYDEEQRVFFAEMRRVIPKEPRDNAKFGGGVAAPQPGKRDSISTRSSPLLLLLLLRP